MGRPSKFTPEICSIILDAIEKGNFYQTACGVAGVSYKNFREWIKRGRSDAPEDAEFRAFRDAVRRARAKAEADSVEAVRADKTWTAKAWFLERSFRQRWGPVSRVQAEVTGKNGAPLRSAPTPETLQAAVSILEELGVVRVERERPPVNPVLPPSADGPPDGVPAV